MTYSLSNVLLVDEPVSVVKSVQAVLAKDGYMVRILDKSQTQKNAEKHYPVYHDALESIRHVRQQFPRMTNIILIPVYD